MMIYEKVTKWYKARRYRKRNIYEFLVVIFALSQIIYDTVEEVRTTKNDVGDVEVKMDQPQILKNMSEITDILQPLVKSLSYARIGQATEQQTSFLSASSLLQSQQQERQLTTKVTNNNTTQNVSMPIQKNDGTTKENATTQMNMNNDGGGGDDTGGSMNTTSEDTTKKNKPLNVLVLYPDDWRHDSIGGVGPYVQTPFLNQLASEGIRFTHNCVTTSICWISRATFFTGQYAARHKSLRLKDPVFHRESFSSNHTSWPSMLRDAGYYTGHIGKWQFDELWRVRREFFNWTSLHEGLHWYPMTNFRTGKRENVHASDRARNDVFEFLNKRPKDKPFALSVAFYPPKAVGTGSEPGAQWSPKPETQHLFDNVTIPMPNDTFHELPPPVRREKVGRQRWAERFNHTEKYQVSIKNYYRLIYEVDQVCKEIIDRLKQDGLYDNTLIIFTTDNGFFLGEHGLTGKWYPYEESIRIPLIIRDPRMPEHKRNTLDDSFTLNIDLAETILGAAGLKPPSVMQGRDMSDLYLRNVTDWRKEFYYEYPLQNGPWFPAATALVRKDYKYMYWPKTKYECLYDMINDPKEMNDLGHDPKYKDIVSEMRTRHNELKEKVKHNYLA